MEVGATESLKEVDAAESVKKIKSPRWGGASVGLEASCVTLAKGTHVRGSPRARLDGIRMSARERKRFHESATRKTVCNCVAKLSADAGQVFKAERWIMKLDGTNNSPPEVGAFNALVFAATRAGDIEKAEQWFAKIAEKGLHPELVGLEANLESYNIMITACAEDSDLRTSAVTGWRCGSFGKVRGVGGGKTWQSVVRACIQKGEPRRAHKWMEALIASGCSNRAGYSAKFVKAERQNLRSLRTWNVDAFIELVIDLVKALASVHNTITANHWLGYLHECGLKYDEAPEAWEHVREQHPQEIVASVLSGEVANVGAPHSPALRRPATLAGERRPDTRAQAVEPWKAYPSKAMEPWKPYPQERPMSQISTRPGTSIGNAGWQSQLSGWAPQSTPRSQSTSRAASPALRKVLIARSHGATPILSRLDSSQSQARDSLRSNRGQGERGPTPLADAGAATVFDGAGGVVGIVEAGDEEGGDNGIPLLQPGDNT